MGICYSCFRSIYPEDGSSSNGPTERTPLIQEYPANSISTNNPYKNDAERLDRAKRQQVLNAIVGFTGENLIDVTSVAQPEVHTIGKSAAEYKKLVEELDQSKPNQSITNENTSILPKLPTMKVLSDEERAWLKGLSSSASTALQQEIPVELPGPLVHTF